jgi:HlyD family secretion protein
MKRFFLWMVVMGIVTGGGAAGYRHFHKSEEKTDDGVYRTAPVIRDDITFFIKSSGTVQPVQSVKVGAVVSGPIHKVYVDFNDKVKKGQLLAEVDQTGFKASVAQADASLKCAQANLMQAEAKFEQAKRDWKRAEALKPAKAIADTDYDVAKANFETSKANVELCKAQILQSKGMLDSAKTNLGYTQITSFVDGIITDRKIDPGQSMAATYQTPELFVVAPDLEKRVHVLASVDEADIGFVRAAEARKQPVTFTVDAYRDDTFTGTIRRVRLTPTTLQNIVTYTVEVEAPNPQLKLMPGMTANLKFQIEKRQKVLKVPNAALRFAPKADQVHECDRPIAEGKAPDSQAKKQGGDSAKAAATDDDESSAESKRKERYVWVVDGDLLSAVKITTGLESEKFTEAVSGKLHEGQLLVTGTKTR